jgi:hypothetical protein
MKVAVISTNPEFYRETKSMEKYLQIDLEDFNIEGVEFYSTYKDVEEFFKSKDIASYDVVFVSSSVTHPNRHEQAVHDFTNTPNVFVFTGGSFEFFKANFETRSFYYNAAKFLLWYKKYGTFETRIISYSLVPYLEQRKREMERNILSKLKEQKTLTIKDMMRGIKLQPLSNWAEIIDYEEINFLLGEM